MPREVEDTSSRGLSTMIKIKFSEADSEALRYWRFQHPDPRVQVRMEALYLRSQRVANSDILRLCGISKASFHRHLKAYVTGGIEQLKHCEPRQPRSALYQHRTTIEAELQQRPPATVAEAAARIEALTGIARKPTQVRQFLKALGMKPRKVGMIPAKADVEAQEAFKKKSGTALSGSADGPARRLLHGCRPFRVRALFGDPLVLSTPVCQGTCRTPTVECAGGLERDDPGAVHGRESDAHNGRDGL